MMTLQIDLNPELERRLREEAAKCGVAPDNYVVSTLEMRLRSSPTPPNLGEEESDLLQLINQGTSIDVWNRYDELLAKQKSHGLSAEEQSELSQLIDQIDTEHAHRLEALGRLAKLRDIPPLMLMQQLQIGPRTHQDADDV
jgi:hypothetical protein